MPKDLRSLDQRNTTWKSVLEVQSRFPDGIPLLDPIADMKITDDKFKELVQVTCLHSHIIYRCGISNLAIVL